MLSAVDVDTLQNAYFDDDDELNEWLAELRDEQPERLDRILITRWIGDREAGSLRATNYLLLHAEVIPSFSEVDAASESLRFGVDAASESLRFGETVLSSFRWSGPEWRDPMIPGLVVDPQTPNILPALREGERAEHGHIRDYKGPGQLWVVDPGDFEGQLDRLDGELVV